jgi:hypothetical protein
VDRPSDLLIESLGAAPSQQRRGVGNGHSCAGRSRKAASGAEQRPRSAASPTMRPRTPSTPRSAPQRLRRSTSSSTIWGDCDEP